MQRWLSMSVMAGAVVGASMAVGCSHAKQAPANAVSRWTGVQAATAALPHAGAGFDGFDRNEYPGDATMAAMHGTFAFTGYWLTNPPGDATNSWTGKRTKLRAQGWGFLVLANGRLDAEILKSQKKGTSAAALARADAATAVAAAKAEGFPSGTTIFLDQEEGGRMLDEQAAYLLAWTEAVAASAYRPGLYASGQPVDDGGGKTITTIDDVRERVAQGHLHAIAMFDANDACPPAPGCTLAAKPMRASGEPNLAAWQYAQSPRRTEITKACGKTYAADGNCYAAGFGSVFLDMDVAASADPSHGR
jgi:hypothetical protein